MLEIDEGVIRAAQQGDVAAFEKIYRHYSGMAYRVALRMTASVEDAEEVTQQVFLAVHRHLASFAGRSSLKTWIYRIVVNCSLNALKAGRRKHEVAWEEGFEPEDPGQDTRRQAEKEALRDRVEGLLGILPPDQKACLLLRVQEGLSYDEIARTLHINVNTVRSRISRARQVLVQKREAL